MRRARTVSLLCCMACILAAGPAAAAETAISLMAKGDYHAQSGETAQALILYQRAIQQDPQLIECHFKLGRIFFDQEAYSFAERHYEQILKEHTNLTYKHLVLDALFALVYTHHKMAEKVDPGSDRNIYIVKMQEEIDEIIALLSKGGRFDEPHNQYIEVDKEYHLSRAWYLKARLLWDKNRDQEYPNAFMNAYKYFNQLKEKQNRAENYARVSIKEAECLYFLYRHHERRRERSRANAYRASASQLRDDLLARANALLSDPAASFSEDIVVYQRAAKGIDDLMAGRITLSPVFQFFNPR